MNVKIDKKDYDIVVTKDIAAGEIIYKEKPMMATLDPRVEVRKIFFFKFKIYIYIYILI